MTWSIFFLVLCGLFTCGYSGLLAYYGLGSILCRDPVWRAFSREMLPGVVLALFVSLLVTAGYLLADILGYVTIWWPGVPAL